MKQQDGLQQPDVYMEFPHDVEASRAARAALMPLFPHDGPLELDVMIVASELVTNVVLHTNDGGALAVWLGEGWSGAPIRIEVADSDAHLPSPMMPHDGGGRGLHIVEALANRWGIDPTAGGKVVWAEFIRTSSPDSPF